MLRIPFKANRSPRWSLHDHPQLRGCTGWWPLNEGVGSRIRDFSGRRRDGTITYSHATSLLTWAPGRDNYDQALHFEGLDPTAGPQGGHVAWASGLAITDFISTTGSGFSAWVYCEGGGDNPKGLPAAGQGIVGCAWDSGAGIGLSRTCKTAVGEVDTLWAVARPSGTTLALALATVSSLSTGWHHVWCSHTGGLLIGGVDGALTASTACTTQSFLLGITKVGKGDSKQFKGGIQDARIYNRSIDSTFAAELYRNPDAPFRPRMFFVPDMPGVDAAAEFVESVERRDLGVCILITIEGLGTGDGQHRFCSTVPLYAASNSLYKGWLVEWPPVMSERVDELGGMAESGELTVQIQDHDDTLTGLFRIDKPPVTTYAGNVSISSTVVIVQDGTAVDAVGQAFYVGNETLMPLSIAGENITVERGALDSDAQPHSDGQAVFSSIPYLWSRRLRYYLVPYDAPSANYETLVGTYSINGGPTLSADLNDYVLTGKSQLRHIGRSLCSQIGRWTFDRIDGDAASGDVVYSAQTLANTRNLSDVLDLWPDQKPYIKIDDEIIQLNTNSGVFTIHLRGQGGTVEDEHDAGASIAHVLTGDPLYGSFRYSPDASTSRSSGTWIAADSETGGVHFVDAMLCLLTSSAREGDGLELTNFDADIGINWSSLPIGFGVACPASRIDFDSFLNVKARTPDMVFPYLTLGDKAVTFEDFINENFLKPLGAFIVMASGRVKLSMPSIPLSESTPDVVWDLDVIQSLESAPSQDTAAVASSVTFKLRTPTGQEVPETVNSGDFGELYGQSGFYAVQENPIEMPLPGVRADQAGINTFVRRLGLRRLFKMARPPWKIPPRTDLAQYQVEPGDQVAVTHPELPDFSTGVRGWTTHSMLVTEKVLHVSPDFTGYQWMLTGPGPSLTKFGRISAAAHIVGITNNGSNRALEMSANRYTCSDARNGLPTTDAAAFTIGDVVRLIDRDGTSASANTQTVNAVSSVAVQVDGNFGGDLAAGQILVFADYDEVSADQSAAYAFFADQSDKTIGAGNGTPWAYTDI